jgi:glycosyltransferase involved in cell wall biosynthesis
MTPSAASAVKLSALVVTCNEAKHLAACLGALSFCDELVVVDLGSSDDSVAIAKRAGARVVPMPRAPFVEAVWPSAVELLQHDWVVLVDPDEIMPPGIGPVLQAHLARDPQLGMIAVPSAYHVGNRPLRGTRWGQRQPKKVVFRRSAVDFVPVIHAGHKLRRGFTRLALDEAASGAIEHHWVDSVGQLIAKHVRYLPREGEALYRRGERFALGRATYVVARQAYRDLIHPNAHRDGVLGVSLGLFSVAYEAACWLSLRRHQRRVEHDRP